MLHALAFTAGVGILFFVLLDAFETIVLPRRVTRPFRLTTFFYRVTWRPWRLMAGAIPPSRRRETFLGFFGPLSLILLLATWALGLVLGFAILLWEFESWAADILESHISYPVLCLYRSQHDNQSWLAALTTILDVSAFAIVGVDSIPQHQARLTFAMARHAIVDLTQIFHTPPILEGPDRLPTEKLTTFRK